MKTNICISPETAKMLQALKALRSARQFYYDAMLMRGGVNHAIKMNEANEAKWRPIEDLLREEISGAIDIWSVGGSIRGTL